MTRKVQGTRHKVQGEMTKRGQESKMQGTWRVLVLLGFLGVACMSLDSFLFDPTRLDHDYLQPADMDASWHVRFIIPDSLIVPVMLTASAGKEIYGFFVKAGSDSALPGMEGYTAIYNHGNGANINRYWGRVELLWQTGMNVFIYEYEGYGRCEGTPSGDACYADAEAALKYVLGRQDVDSTKLVYYGWSLGSFMAMHLAVDVRPPAAVVLENPIASTSTVAREAALFKIPGRFLAVADFDNEKRMAALDSTPLLLMFGTLDETAVPERNAEVLLREAVSAGVAVDSLPVAGAGHADLMEVMGYPQYREALARFITGK
jgi:uncharacterized protein